MHIDLTLGPKVDAFCVEMGAARQAKAEERGRMPGNNASTDHDTGLAWHILGARCEGVCWAWLKPIKWHHEIMDDVRGVPDLEVGMLKINVKGVRAHHHCLLVQRDAPDDWVYLLACAEEQPRYRVYGWLWGYEAKAYPVKELQPGRPAHVVEDKAKLRSPAELHQRVETERAGAYLCSVCGGYATRTVDNGETWQCREHDLAKKVERREE